MLHPFLENTAKIVQYILLWIVYAFLQTFVLYFIVALPLWVIVLDGFVHAAIFGLLVMLLWSVVKYGNYSVLTAYQRIINYVALAILTIAVWLGIGYGLSYLIFGNTFAAQLIPLIPIRGFIGLLIYLLIIQRFRFAFHQTKTSIETSAPVEISEEIKPKKVAESD